MTDIETNLEHEVSELICLKCFNRWIGVYPTDTPLKDIKCKCGEIGYTIKTGQTLYEDDSDMETDPRYKSMVRMWGKKIAKEKYKAFIGIDEK